MQRKTDPAHWDAAGKRPLTVAVLCAFVLLIDGFDTQSISYAAPQVAKQMHMSRDALGTVFSAALVGLMLGYLLSSPLADRIGTKRMLVLGVVIFGAFSLATVWTGSVSGLVALRFLTGVGLGAVAPAAISLTDEHSPRHLRATFVLAIYCGFSLGFVAAGFAASQLLTKYGWASLFWSGALLSLILCPLLMVLLPPQDVPVRATRNGRAKLTELFQHGRTRGTVLIWAIFAINLAAFYLLQSWLPTLLTGLHRDIGEVATATALSTFGGIVVAILIGPAMDRFGAGRSLAALYALGMILVGFLGPSLPASMWQLSLASFFAGFCISGGQKSAIALATLFYPASLGATGLGWALGIGRAGGVAGPLIAGMLLGNGWSATQLFILVALSMGAACLATLAIRMPEIVTRAATRPFGPASQAHMPQR
ncbi:aromatic acid/H+ symport family MFS transporter [Beijerinckia sp. L45]|uniref:MFS transporter n=1 Tax=Beijerinckia sp. L45 TaxID=1641855 RepID=UPI00131B535B|nr:aromatic acid/H+ symport family MFS transporter [Beijerinckia sp. L45]